MEVQYAYDQDIPKEAMPEIPRVQSQLAAAMGAVEVGLDQLEDRLEAVLRPRAPEGPSPTNDTTMVAPATAPMTDFLSAQAARGERHAARLALLVGRLAL